MCSAENKQQVSQCPALWRAEEVGGVTKHLHREVVGFFPMHNIPEHHTSCLVVHFREV